MFLVGVLILVCLLVIVRAVKFLRLPGHLREEDKIIAAGMIAASVLCIVARVATFVNHPALMQSNSMSTALWVGFGLFNAMLYLGILHRMIVTRSCSYDRRRSSPIAPPSAAPH